ncbi:DUF308 domain-containing protein [Riemerella anatipestifer]|uniref:DUF308 domain-containing protein n=1 Tax=Riemerella anatipestifer TaxID=34085 RepID=UPI00129D9CB2|nr:DUF308 domain-containing protein [Riemerella anatipestifer]MRM96947.1 DUF308 domain-containing protein [Riemerella anatipestifer]MRN00945.1 DUF308 domain-containing protein [Riemerella anatipestifer]MRN03112.1 DUF308 domain-containing protein [Riemerella anatipestifer]
MEKYITFFVSKILELFSAINRRKIERGLNTDEMLEFFEKNDPEYHRDFVVPNMKEDYHYIRTGIRASEKNIKKYDVFLKKLDGDYTWEHIRIAKSQLQVEEDGIKVKDDNNICLGNIVLVISLLFIVAGVGLFLYLIKFEHKTVRDIILTVFFPIVSFLIGSFLMMSVRPIFLAKRIKEDLKKKRKNSTE